MSAIVSLTEGTVLTVLRAFLLAMLPPGVEVVRGQANLVAEPDADDYVLMTPMGRYRLGTNISTYADALGAGTRATLQPTRLTIQLDVHGPNSGENAQVVATLLRDDAACQAFRASGIDCQPLYAEEPRQAPFINGENQFEERWTVDAVLQMNAAVTLPQDFAGQLAIMSRFIVADADAPALAASNPGHIATVPMLPVPVGQGGSSYATTIIGDGLQSAFTIQHGLNTQDVDVIVRDPTDGNAEVPDIDNTAPDPNTVRIVLGAPLPVGAPLRIIVFTR